MRKGGESMIGSMIGMCEGGGHADGMQSVAWSEASMSTGTLRTALEALARPGALLTHSELFILYTRYVMVWRVLVLGRMCVAPIHAWHARTGCSGAGCVLTWRVGVDGSCGTRRCPSLS